MLILIGGVVCPLDIVALSLIRKDQVLAHERVRKYLPMSLAASVVEDLCAGEDLREFCVMRHHVGFPIQIDLFNRKDGEILLHRLSC